MTERIGFGNPNSLALLLKEVINCNLDMVYCRDDNNYIYCTFKRKEKEEKELDTSN